MNTIENINSMLAEIADEEQRAYMEYMIDCFLEEQEEINNQEELQKQYAMMAANADEECYME